MTHDQMQALVLRQAHAWSSGDLDAIVGDFAPDALFISPGGRWQGEAAIRAAAAAFFAEVSEVSIEVTRVLVDGEMGAVEWRWSETGRADGRRRSADDCIIVGLVEGKIIYWREYIHWH